MDTEKNDVQCSTSEENVKGRVNIGGQVRLFVGKKHQPLKDAMASIQKYHPTFSTTNHILFAEVKGRPGKVVVPPTLLCGWLKEDAIIDIEKISESKKTGSPMAGHQEIAAKLPTFDQQTIFFLKMDDRKNRQSITRISYVDYKCKNICVIANDGDTFLKALEKDGRFINPESFQLQDETGTTLDVNFEAKGFKNEVYSVLAKRPGNRKRNADPTRDSKAESKSTNTASGGIGSNSVITKKEPDDNILTSFSKLVTEDTYQVVVRRVKSMAYESFLEPNEAKNEKTRDKAICNFVKKEFSKSLDQSKPAWLIKKIASATKVVGRIFCGHTTATCFLVKEDIVMTNCHVYDEIVKQIQNPALPEEHKKPTVLFNHEHPNQMENLVKVGVEIDEVIAKSPELDYVLLRLKDHNHQVLRAAQVKVCDVVFQNVPADQADRLVTIIGHPGGQPKAVDTDCRIVSEYLWRDQVQKRVQEIVGFDRYFYLSRKVNTRITSDKYEHTLAYDTSFFEGASGSPVINDQGLVVAMHRCGYKIDEMGPNAISVMEFGVSMTAIFNDLYEKNPSLARELFPHYQQPMDISHD